jgi:sugar-specific transcriptional regulator TrmB/DNA-binding CsgD family transcriptional regulator
MLEVLGVSDVDEVCYRALLHVPRRTADELADDLDRGVTGVRRSIARLEELGLVTRLTGTPIRFVPARPDIAVDALVARRQQELTQVQVEARNLLHELPPERQHAQEELIELVVGTQAVAARFTQMQQTVEHELVALDRPPYAQPVEPGSAAELDLLARGVRVRGIYAPEGFEVEGRYDMLREMMAAGEEARIHGAIPMKLAIADRREAILPLSFEQTPEQALVVHGSNLLTALVALFELLWDLAVPLPSTRGEVAAALVTDASLGIDGDEIARLMAAGLSDQAIARQLGISLRTLNRRFSTMLRELGAQTRFQAGIQIARRGLDTPGSPRIAETRNGAE